MDKCVLHVTVVRGPVFAAYVFEVLNTEKPTGWIKHIESLSV